MGRLRDLKKATEAYWGGKISRDDLLAEGKRLRAEHWKIQQAAGVDSIPSNDFAFYDQFLDHSQLFGVIPQRYSQHKLDPLDEYFAMGRGHQKDGVDVPALEMVKWFDSNYHIVKPAVQENQQFKLNANPKPVAEFKEALALGIKTTPVVVGPVTFLALAKADRGQNVDPIDLLPALLPLYVDLLAQLKAAGAETIQVDEPVLVLDVSQKVKAAFKPAYDVLGNLGAKAPKITLATYFGDIVHNIQVLKDVQNVDAIHVDLVRNPEQLDAVIAALGPNQTLSAGVVGKIDYSFVRDYKVLIESHFRWQKYLEEQP